MTANYLETHTHNAMFVAIYKHVINKISQLTI